MDFLPEAAVYVLMSFKCKSLDMIWAYGPRSITIKETLNEINW